VSEAHIIFLALLAVACACGAIGLSAVAWRLFRAVREVRHREVLEPLRPVVLELVAAEEPQAALVERLASLERKSWSVLEPELAFTLMAKVKPLGPKGPSFRSNPLCLSPHCCGLP